jgi:hypothetical protein
MSISGISSFSNALSSLAEALREANESPYITEQQAARGDPQAIRKLQDLQEREALRQRLQHRTPQGDIGDAFDLLA